MPTTKNLKEVLERIDMLRDYGEYKQDEYLKGLRAGIAIVKEDLKRFYGESTPPNHVEDTDLDDIVSRGEARRQIEAEEGNR